MTVEQRTYDTPKRRGLTAYLPPAFVHWAIIIGIGCALFWPSTQSLLAAWSPDASDDTYAHGYYIAALCFWLGWRRASRVSESEYRPSVTAKALLLSVGIIWLIALRGGIQTLHQLLFPLLLVIALSAAFGLKVATRTGFGVAYLVFAIPVWGILNGALQRMTIVAADLMLRMTGVTASLEDNLIFVPAGVFEIAGGCSGLRYFVVALAIAALYGELNDCSLKNRLKLLSLGLTVGVVANWLRVYGVILAGYLTDMQHYVVRVEHASFGWVVFASSLGVFFWIARRWAVPLSFAQPVRPVLSTARITSLRGITVAVVAMCVAPALGATRPVRPAHMGSETSLMAQLPKWHGPLPASSSLWEPMFVGYDAIARAEYTNDAERLELLTVAYTHQQQGRELIGHHSSVAGTFPVVSRAEVPSGLAREIVVEDGSDRSVIWVFYQIGSMQTTHPLLAQAYYGVATLISAPLSRLVAVRVRCEAENCDAARLALEDFVTSYKSNLRSNVSIRSDVK